jgi:L-seryl-tRNA(Ser) seleniumtransferase
METPRPKPVHASDLDGQDNDRRADGSRPSGQQIPPAIDAMLKWNAIARLERDYGRAPVVEALRDIAERIRAGKVDHGDEAAIAAQCTADLQRRFARSQRRVLNLTGTVLHTNLGRALIAEEAIEAAVEAMRNATTLEYDLEKGERGERDRHIERWLTELTGAEAVTAVNNNAAAVLLVLSALARDKEVIVPHTRHHAGSGLQTRRGRHDKPDPSRRL